MKSLSTNFSNLLKTRANREYYYIVKMVGSSNTYYFSAKDGTITDSPLHWGGASVVGSIVWGLMKRAHLAERAMRRAKPIPEAVIWLRRAATQGHAIRYVTAREKRYFDLTADWLQEHGLDFQRSTMRLRPPHLGAVSHKAEQVAGAALYLEDQLEIAELVYRRLLDLSFGDEPLPLVVHLTSWRLQMRLLDLCMMQVAVAESEHG